MIRHQQKQMRPPKKFLLPVTDGFKQFFGHVRQGQLIAKAFLTVDGDEIDFPMRIHPERDLVWKMFARGPDHAKKIKQERGDAIEESSGVQFAMCGVACRATTSKRPRRVWRNWRTIAV